MAVVGLDFNEKHCHIKRLSFVCRAGGRGACYFGARLMAACCNAAQHLEYLAYAYPEI